MKFVNIIAISALFIGCQPLVSDFLPDSIADTGAAFAKGNGDKGDRGDRGNNGGGNRGASQRGNGKSVSPDRGSRSANARASHQHTTHVEEPTQVEKPKNVHAQLKGLNSLNRNINGLMNSSDPKMDLFREFVIASAGNEAARGAFTDSLDGFDPDGAYQALLDDLGLPAPTTAQEFATIADQLAALSMAPEPLAGDFDTDAAHLAAVDGWLTSTADASVALALYENSDLSTAVADASVAGGASSEDAMIEAMVAGLNATGAGPVTAEDMTPEMIEWVAGQMGVGDADGFIDAYLAQIAEQDEASADISVIDGETIDDTNG